MPCPAPGNIISVTSSFFTGLANNPKVPDSVTSKAQVELSSGVPFVSDSDLQTALDDAHVPPDVADSIVDDNANARIAGLRAALAVLGLLALVAFVAARRLPTKQPDAPASAASTSSESPAPDAG